MKRLYYIISFLVILFSFNSCYDDSSSLAVKEIAEIQVTSNVKDTINLYLGDNISIKNQYSYTGDDISWQWSIGKYTENAVTDQVSTVFKEISTEPDLEYKTTDLGHYFLRLVTTNKYGSDIRYYHVFVNSEFEEGYLILGKREDGKGSLAFMKTLTPEEIAQGLQPEFRQNLFAYTNDGEELGEGPIDCDKVYDKLYIMCGKAQKLYQIDAKSFQLVHVFDYSIYGNDFVPQDLISYDSKYCREIYSTSPNGGVAKVQIADLEIFPYTDLPQNIKFTRTYDRPNYSASKVIAFIDDVNSKIYASGFNAADFSFSYFPCYDYFDGREIIQVFFDVDGNMLVYTIKEDKYYLTKIGSTLTSFETLQLDVVYERVCTENTTLFNKNSVFEVNDPSSCLFFGNQNMVYKWTYNQSEIPSKAFITLPDGEIIKCMNQSADHKQLYIGTYNSSRSGLKGSLYIYDSDTGKVIGKPYEGVADEPVKVMYKVK